MAIRPRVLTLANGSEVFRIGRIAAFALSSPVAHGPVSTLGKMPVRNGVLLQVNLRSSATGWGEIWCNFPPRGNLAKLALIEDVIGPEIVDRDFVDLKSFRDWVEARFGRMMLHTGEAGPFTHATAGLETALADALAREAGLPLGQYLATASSNTVAVYASTPNADLLEESVAALIEAGHDAVKLKIGFGSEHDENLVSRFRQLAPQAELMVDANQNWSLRGAVEAIERLQQYGLRFVEEPLAANSPLADWTELSRRVSVPVAAGENIAGEHDFSRMVDAGALSVVQPDLAKWGGPAGALAVGRYANRQGATCFLHYMGTAIGLAASLHTLAAIGGSGRVELDANTNPLRTDLCDLDLAVTDGRIAVPSGDGIGATPDPDALRRFTVARCEVSSASAPSGPARRGTARNVVMIARLRPEARQKYLSLHRNPDPRIVEALRRRHHRNYSLYLGDDLLVASFTYYGEDLDRDRAELRAEPQLGDWFARTAECQVVPQLPDTIWTRLDRIFHCE